MSKSSTSPQPIQPLSVGNVVSAGLRLYRDRFKSYFSLALRALLWAFVPIYGWAKNYQIQAIISRQVYKELINQPEPISTTRTQLNYRFWSFWAAQFLIGLICFAVNMGLSIVGGIIVAIPQAILGGASGSGAESNIVLALIQLVVNLITLIIYIWFYSHFFIAELPLAIENNMNSTNCIGRSWELTQGFVVRVQIIVLVAGLITVPIISLALVPALLMLLPLLGVSASDSPDTFILGIFSIIFWALILAMVGSTLMMPFWQAIKAVIYYDIRSRKEGLGLQVRDSLGDSSLE